MIRILKMHYLHNKNIFTQADVGIYVRDVYEYRFSQDD